VHRKGIIPLEVASREPVCDLSWTEERSRTCSFQAATVVPGKVLKVNVKHT